MLCIGAILFVLNQNGLLSAENIARSTDVTIFYHATYLTTLIECSLLAVSLSLCYMITRLVHCNGFSSVYLLLSKRLTVIYIAQWIIIPWLSLCLPQVTEKVSPWRAVPLTLFVLALSAAAASVYAKLTQKKPGASAGSCQNTKS